MRLLDKLPSPFSLRAYNLVFIPGTKLFQRAVQDGIIKGIGDSGFELDFLAGYDHRTHDWKKKNHYLNSLMYLMQGKFTWRRMGFVPRRIIPVLASPRVVDFCDRHTRIGETIVALANLCLRMRLAHAGLLGNVDRYVQRLRNRTRASYGSDPVESDE